MTSAGSTSKPWRHVLVTTDLSPAAEPALHAAADLARRTQARVTVLNVLDFSGLGDSEALRGSLIGLERSYRADAIPKLEALCEQIFKDVSAEVAVVEGLGGSATICTYAREHDVDLIVIATHGRTGFRRLALGSVSERVVQHAPCDVMVVRSPSEAKGE
jgi:nucleotide-binding universal stress UspA family protein